MNKNLLFRGGASLIGTAAVVAALLIAPAAANAGTQSSNLEPGGVQSKNGSLPTPSYAQALASGNWESEPYGLVYKDCAHQVPTGSSVNAAGNIVSASGAITVVPSCPYQGTIPRPGSVPSAPAAAPTPGVASPSTSSPSTGGGWLEASWWNSGTPVTYLSSSFTVPSPPHTNGGTDFFFSSLENSVGTLAILQPVVQWGVSQAGGGNYYGLADWYVTSGNANVYYSNIIPVNPGDTIDGTTQRTYSCTGTSCTWGINAYDMTGQARVINLAVSSSLNFDIVQGGVMETYGTPTCSYYPANGSANWSDITVGVKSISLPSTLTYLKPSFGQYYEINSGQARCGATETSSTTNAPVPESTTSISWTAS